MKITRPSATISRFFCISSVLIAAALSGGCDTEPESDVDDDADAETETETETLGAGDTDPDGVCRGDAPELDCGVLLDSDGCGDSMLGDQSAADCSGNEAVARCAIDATAEGTAFRISLRYFRYYGQFDESTTLNVEGDGAGFGSSGGVGDLCTSSSSYNFEGFEPAACTDAACVMNAMRGVSERTYCTQELNCDEGV